MIISLEYSGVFLRVEIKSVNLYGIFQETEQLLHHHEVNKKNVKKFRGHLLFPMQVWECVWIFIHQYNKEYNTIYFL